eukprot:COSAG03_NODE_1377_length_4212_cov_82.121080_5_plen_152_part_00
MAARRARPSAARAKTRVSEGQSAGRARCGSGLARYRSRPNVGMGPGGVVFLFWLLQVAVMAGSCWCSRRGNNERGRCARCASGAPPVKVDSGCPDCLCLCCGTEIFCLGAVMRMHQILAIVVGLIPCEPSAGASCCVAPLKSRTRFHSHAD